VPVAGLLPHVANRKHAKHVRLFEEDDSVSKASGRSEANPVTSPSLARTGRTRVLKHGLELVHTLIWARSRVGQRVKPLESG
jgi:hypothetical protein